MIKLKISTEGSTKTYEVKSKLDEMTIKEFEHISSILGDKDKDHIEKWSEIFIYCGLPSDILDYLDAFDFMELIKEYNMNHEKVGSIRKEIEVEGITYRAYEDEFKISVKEMRLIESLIKKNSTRYLADVLAVVYKRPDVDKNIVYDNAHIAHKSNLFRNNIKADVAVPLVGYIASKLTKTFEIDDQTS